MWKNAASSLRTTSRPLYTIYFYSVHTLHSLGDSSFSSAEWSKLFDSQRSAVKYRTGAGLVGKARSARCLLHVWDCGGSCRSAVYYVSERKCVKVKFNFAKILDVFFGYHCEKCPVVVLIRLERTAEIWSTVYSCRIYFTFFHFHFHNCVISAQQWSNLTLWLNWNKHLELSKFISSKLFSTNFQLQLFFICGVIAALSLWTWSWLDNENVNTDCSCDAGHEASSYRLISLQLKKNWWLQWAS